MQHPGKSRIKVVYGAALAAAGAAALYAGYRLAKALQHRGELKRRETRLDQKVLDTMDGSDAIATY